MTRIRSEAALALLALLAALACFSLIFRSSDSVYELPLTEDGYYMLAVSRNLALGQATIDGETLTNGFQPLLAFLVVPFYMLTDGDRYTTLRWVLATHWLFHLGTALLLGLIVRDHLRESPLRHAAFWLTAFLWLAARYILLLSYNGLETGCVLFFYALCWRLYQLGWESGWRLGALGLIFGLTVLARIDATFLVVVFSAYQLLAQRHRLGEGVRRAALIGVPALLVSSPWWAYNQLYFGALMPSSGTSQSSPFELERLLAGGLNLLQVLVPYVQIRYIEGPIQLALQAGALALIGLLLAGQRELLLASGQPNEAARRRALAFAACLIIASLLLVLYYVLTSWATHFYGRYFSPLALIGVTLAGLAGARLLSWRWGTPLALAGCALLALIMGGSLLGWHLQRGAAQSPFYDEQLQLVLSYVPEEDMVAAGQSGTLGYFRDRVVNLDGKVNAEALRYRGRMWEYLRQRDIRWFCDWSGELLGSPPEAQGWSLVARRGQFLLYQYTGP